MSDEPEARLFPPELSSAWSALVACGLNVTVFVALQLTPQFKAWNFLIPGAVAAVACGFGRWVSPYRCLGFAPPLATVAVGLAAWQVAFGSEAVGTWLFGLTLGGVLGGGGYHVEWVRSRVGPGHERLRPGARVITVLLWTGGLLPFVPLALVGLNRAAVSQSDPIVLQAVLIYFLVACIVLCVWCWLRFLRPFVELCLEPIARTLYRIKAKGTKQFPPFGPCLVIANHGFWFDPCILGVILPRPITPIMTQRFYEQWFLKPLLKYVFRVIVVPETPIKRTTPELEQAVAALDRGEVVVIFPEGYLRRKEEVPLRRFGQGVWRILSARPVTPVVACWIEGGWGSKFSYKDGPPTKNKRMDLRRKIEVATSAPETVPAEVLADQMATRIHLMNRVAAMRVELGLAPLPAFEVKQVAEHHDEPA
jgi:1-acyl-sn-glycerol-3-phosphate acyltransferase